MPNYIDGFTLPIPRKHLKEYQQVVESVSKIWKEHGALAYYEYVSDDIKLEGTRSFSELLGTSEEEATIFGWVVFDSKEARDQANNKVAQDPRMADLIKPLLDPENTIFNAGRMAYGAFRPIVG